VAAEFDEKAFPDMSNFQLNSVTAPTPIQAAPQAASPKPPKAQSDHKPVNDATTSRGPAVVLSGSLAKPTDKGRKDASQNGSPSQSAASQGGGQSAQTSNAALGQHINHVI
jgi:hypothetical protein